MLLHKHKTVVSGGYLLRVDVKNETNMPLVANKITAFHLDDVNMSGECKVYRNGRHKHDIPTTFTVGVKDKAFFDALQELSESGEEVFEKQGMDNHIISDQLTIVKGEKILLLGFLQAENFLNESIIRFCDNKIKSATLCYVADNMTILPGETVKGNTIAVLEGENEFELIDKYVELYKQTNKLTPKKQPKTVYCTWYYYGKTITYEDIKSNLQHSKGLPIDVFQIDDGWQKCYSDWEANEKFPIGMDKIAEEIKSYGYTPGIWTAPFLVDKNADIKNEWLLKTSIGTPVIFPMDGLEYYILDTTLDSVYDFITGFYRRLVKWGYTYHKLDFTRAVMMAEDIVYQNSNYSRAMAYRKGIEAARRGIGQDNFMLVCGGLYDTVADLSDAHRTGSDVLGMWDKQNPPYTIKQNVMRYWQNKLWNNDPDALMIRRKSEMFRNLKLSLGTLSDSEALLSVVNQYIAGGIVCFTEDLAEIDHDRLSLLRHITPPIGKSATPIDLFNENNRYPMVFHTDCGKCHTVVVANWYDEQFETTIDFSKIVKYESFIVSEFFSQEINWDTKKLNVNLLPQQVKIYRIVENKETVILHTNGTFSMNEITNVVPNDNGIEFDVDWKWDIPLEIMALINGKVKKQVVNSLHKGRVVMN